MSNWYGQAGSADSLINNLWSQAATTVDLRAEFNSLVLGSTSSLGIGTWMLHRVLDRNGLRCPCWDQTRGSSSSCKYCKGESYRWQEHWRRGWFTQTYGRALVAATQVLELRPGGRMDLDKALIYLPYTAEPETGDSLFRIKLDLNGKPYYPVERVDKWRAVNVEDRRQEGGVLAFWLVLCERVEF